MKVIKLEALLNNDLDKNIALFLDVDGTLMEFSENYKEVKADKELLYNLSQIQFLIKDSIALISGRTIIDLDNIFFPLQLPAAGQHGLERRKWNGIIEVLTKINLPKKFLSHLKNFKEKNYGLILENKEKSIAIHFRKAPSLENKIEKYVSHLLEGEKNFHFIKGNKVIEIKPKFFNKGTAISNFMNEVPFIKRLPIFIGDDTTDEDGFKYINSVQGISVKVGESTNSSARYELKSVSEVNYWLNQLRIQLKKNI